MQKEIHIIANKHGDFEKISYIDNPTICELAKFANNEWLILYCYNHQPRIMVQEVLQSKYSNYCTIM